MGNCSVGKVGVWKSKKPFNYGRDLSGDNLKMQNPEPDLWAPLSRRTDGLGNPKRNRNGEGDAQRHSQSRQYQDFLPT